MLNLEVNSFVSLIAASSVFSWFGVMYFGIPIFVLLTSAISLSTPECRAFHLLLTGVAFAIMSIFVVAAYSDRQSVRLRDDELVILANVAVCIASVVGVVCCRIAHGLLHRTDISKGDSET